MFTKTKQIVKISSVTYISVFVMVASTLLTGVFFILLFTKTLEAPSIVEEPEVISDVSIGTANPAAVYCNEMGYQYYIKDNRQSGVCVMPSGQECDEWSFYSGDCGIDYSYCASKGYQTIQKIDGQDPFNPKYTACADTIEDELGVVSQIELGSVTKLINLPAKSVKGSASVQDIVKSAQSTINNIINLSTFSRLESVNDTEIFDWRDRDGKNYITTPKEQGLCGSCWAFATTALVEAKQSIMLNSSPADIDLAEETLISDCHIGVEHIADQNCNGGDSSKALIYLQENPLLYEGALSYQDDSCTFRIDDTGETFCDYEKCTYYEHPSCSNVKCDMVQGDPNIGWRVISPWFIWNDGDYIDVDSIKYYLERYGPITTGINIRDGFWDEERKYICIPGEIKTNHAVLIVGYDDTKQAWIVKNSYGNTWESGGFFYAAYDSCGIGQYGSFVDSVTDGYCGNNFCDAGEGCDCQDCSWYPQCDDTSDGGNGGGSTDANLCGDGAISISERYDTLECDGNDLGPATCETLGFMPSNTLQCADSCYLDTSQCQEKYCGFSPACEPGETFESCPEDCNSMELSEEGIAFVDVNGNNADRFFKVDLTGIYNQIEQLRVVFKERGSQYECATADFNDFWMDRGCGDLPEKELIIPKSELINGVNIVHFHFWTEEGDYRKTPEYYLHVYAKTLCDVNEKILQRNVENSEIGFNADPYDFACCINENDCVYGGKCYSTGLYDLGLNNNYYCTPAGYWQDAAYSPTQCLAGTGGTETYCKIATPGTTSAICSTDDSFGCCSPGQCSYLGNCYNNAAVSSVNNSVDTADISKDKEICTANGWQEADANSVWCYISSKSTWVTGSNSPAYDPFFVNGFGATDDWDNDFTYGYCCGDDPFEYYVAVPGSDGCCPYPDSCIVNGKCASQHDPEICGNGIDDNCNGMIDEAEDVDGDGYSACINDCNDRNAQRNPGMTEICGNNIDENCNGLLDYLDTESTNPTASEIYCTNNIDDDCDGTTDINDSDCNCEAQGGVCVKDPTCTDIPLDLPRSADNSLFCVDSGSTCCMISDTSSPL